MCDLLDESAQLIECWTMSSVTRASFWRGPSSSWWGFSSLGKSSQVSLLNYLSANLLLQWHMYRDLTHLLSRLVSWSLYLCESTEPPIQRVPFTVASHCNSWYCFVGRFLCRIPDSGTEGCFNDPHNSCLVTLQKWTVRGSLVFKWYLLMN